MSRFDASLLGRAAAWLSRSPSTAAPAIALEPTPAPADLAVQIAAELCKRFEGFYACPYLCPAGVPTIGYGNTHYLDGRAVRLTDPPISREAAERLLIRWIERESLPAVLRLCPGVREPRRLAALIDFHFNLGTGSLASSTLRKRVNAGDWADVPAQLMRWVYAAGKVLRGLVARRQAEADLV